MGLLPLPGLTLRLLLDVRLTLPGLALRELLGVLSLPGLDLRRMLDARLPLPGLALRLLLDVWLPLPVLALRLLLRVLLHLPVLASRLLLSGLLPRPALALLLHSVNRSSDPEQQERDPCTDKPDSFHSGSPFRSCPRINLGPLNRPAWILERLCMSPTLFAGLVSRGLRVQCVQEQFRRGGRVNRAVDYDVFRGGSFSVELLVGIAIGTQS